MLSAPLVLSTLRSEELKFRQGSLRGYGIVASKSGVIYDFTFIDNFTDLFMEKNVLNVFDNFFSFP